MGTTTKMLQADPETTGPQLLQATYSNCTWHLYGTRLDMDVARPADADYWLCLEGYAEDMTTDELREEFAQRAIPGHISGIVCGECYDSTLTICDKCYGWVSYTPDPDQTCPHCGKRVQG